MHFRHKFINYFIQFIPSINFVNTFQNKRVTTKGTLLKYFFIPKLLSNPLASCCLTNFKLLLSHTTQFYKNIILPLFVLATFGLLLLHFFYTSNNNMITLFLNRLKSMIN